MIVPLRTFRRLPTKLFFLNIKLMLTFKWYRQLQMWQQRKRCEIWDHVWLPTQILHTATGPSQGSLLICDRCNVIKHPEPVLVKMWFREPAIA